MTAATLGALIARQVPQRPARKRGITRERQWDKRPALPSRAYVNAFSGDMALDWRLSDGARATLLLILQLSGGPGRELVTLTKSLATLRGVTDRTIRNHYAEGEAAGYLDRWHNRATNEVRLVTRPCLHARPGASAVPEDRKKRLPAPWARPRQGRKLASAINPYPNSLDLPPAAAAAVRKTEGLLREDAAAALAARRQRREAEAAAEDRRRRLARWGLGRPQDPG